MNRKWKRLAFLLIGTIALMLLPVQANAAAGKVVISVSATSVEKGNHVSVTVTALNSAGNKISANMAFTFDGTKFSYQGSNASTAVASGNTVTVTGSNATFTLKALTKGTSTVSVSGTSADGETLTAAGVNLTITGADSSKKSNSADNSLKSLSLSDGELSPAFQYSVTSYTATVGSDINKITVKAVASNKDAEVTSIKGNENLKEGENTIKITVTAGNGSTAVYKILVTKETGTATDTQKEDTTTEQDNTETTPGDGEFTINGQLYGISECLSDDEIPSGFTQQIVTIGEEQFCAYQYEQTGIYLVYLMNESDETDTGFYSFDPATGQICQALVLNQSDSGSLTTDEQVAYLQKNYDSLYQNYNSLKKKNLIMLISSIIIIVILLIVLINLILFRKMNRNASSEQEDEDEPQEEDDQEPLIEDKKMEQGLGDEVKNMVKHKKEEEYLAACAKNSAKQEHEEKDDDIQFIDFDDM